jgi:hypothetical protein
MSTRQEKTRDSTREDAIPRKSDVPVFSDTVSQRVQLPNSL